MSKPTLCVIVPVYKAAATLDRCVASVLAQQVAGGLHCILVDDGSPDACPEICERYAREYPGLVRVLHQENQGQRPPRDGFASGEPRRLRRAQRRTGCSGQRVPCLSRRR